MKFVVVSLKNTQRIVEVLEMFGHDIDNNKPDFIITYGGDGTVLYAERKYPGIPKITIRAGSVGFKCMYSEEEFEDVLTKIDNGEYKLKEEIKLETTFQGRKYLSLNEMQLHNSSPIKAVRSSVRVNGQILFDNIIGDGVVAAAPFGSTAYYSSISGKEFDNGIGIALNNPYKYDNYAIVSSFDFVSELGSRYVIVDLNSEIYINVLRDDGLLLFDNDDKIIKVKCGDEILIKMAKDTAKFVVTEKS